MKANKRVEIDNHYAPEHPDDKASRKQSSAVAVVLVDDWAKAHNEELLELLWTYGDGRAEEKLAALREKFWTELPFELPATE